MCTLRVWIIVTKTVREVKSVEELKIPSVEFDTMRRDELCSRSCTNTKSVFSQGLTPSSLIHQSFHSFHGSFRVTAHMC